MPWIPLDGAANARDLGGLPTDDGRVTAGHRLLRADNLQDLSASDVHRLVDEFGVTEVVDLRSSAEVAAEGPGPLNGMVEHVHLSIIPPRKDRVTAPPAEAGPEARSEMDQLLDAALLAERDPAADPDTKAAEHYLEYLEQRPDNVAAAVRAIADTPGAALVHCAAGKDRTGVVVALALRAVGVRREDVVADYARTADRIGAVIGRLEASPTYRSRVSRVTVAEHTPRPGAMERFLDEVDARYGGAAAWLTGHGFTPADLDRLKAKLLT